MGSLFGKSSKTTDKSFNRAYEDINSSFSPIFGLAGTGANALRALLSGDTSGFDAFKGATGFNQLLKSGSEGITGNAAARGLLRSGSTGQALVDYGNNAQNQFAQSYINNLLGMSGLGLQAGSLVADAGQTREATSKSKDKSGLGKALGTAATAVAMSDIRLKKNLKKIGYAGKIPLYEFSYLNNDDTYVGVIAQDVSKKYPEALGPQIGGYLSVDYDKLGGLIYNG